MGRRWTDERSVTWLEGELDVGDTLTVHVVEADDPDVPRLTHPTVEACVVLPFPSR